MFGRGNKRTNELLTLIYAELQLMRRDAKDRWDAPTITKVDPPAVVEVEPSILDRCLARDNSITLRESLLNTFTRGKSIDSIAPGYASFARTEIEQAVKLLVDGGKLTTRVTRTTVEGVSAERIIYSVAE